MSVRNGVIIALAIIVNVVTYLTSFTFPTFYLSPIVLVILIFLCKNNMMRLAIFLFSLPVIVFGLGIILVMIYLYFASLQYRKQNEELMSLVMSLCILKQNTF
ncbi:hypothetical protein HXA34_15025 [Salipaludibacillus agaradhaerens]|uniref:hypothetical protein n=1 Tax=Salipaludibacillus agaradhaerens TaxID=76935 RepID=UPI002151207C|nr:hypothetical protein [Salipaludibacillus agaradhaerens]MCR6107617.1 hypothetical protein [Salipaludibacillus agaradhaerens]MCR6119646.1 hypothetical protein [Salipaludibacillus agaradhaerens]